MSAFLVPQTLINSILSHIQFDAVSRDDASPFTEMGYDLGSAAGLKALGSDLWALNHQALNERYGDDSEPKKLFKVHTDTKLVSLPVLYKNICCLRYQCAEGDVPETALFKCLSPFAANVAETYMRKSKEYDDAQWG